jgi:hypothetical protein
MRKLCAGEGMIERETILNQATHSFLPIYAIYSINIGLFYLNIFLFNELRRVNTF